MWEGKLLQAEEGCQLTCDGIRLRKGLTSTMKNLMFANYN
jgi:hypothetical protein